MALSVSEEVVGAVLFIAPEGDIDLSVSGELQQALRVAISRKPGRLVVDLGRVPYMDSSGVATLVDAMQHARQHASRLVLCSLQDKVRSIFEITRLDRVFSIASDRAEAAAL